MSNDFEVVFDSSATFADDDPLASVHRFVGEMRDGYGRLPAPEPRADLAALFREEPEFAAVVEAIPRPSTTITRTRRLRRSILVAAMLVLGLAATTGLAAANVLPNRIQNGVADVLDRVGIGVPRDQPSSPPPQSNPPPQSTPDGSTPATQPDTHSGATTAPATTGPPTSAPPATQPATTAPTATLPATTLPAPLAAPGTTLPPAPTTSRPNPPLPPLPPVPSIPSIPAAASSHRPTDVPPASPPQPPPHKKS